MTFVMVAGTGGPAGLVCKFLIFAWLGATSIGHRTMAGTAPATTMEALPSDPELLRLLAHELRLDGGCSELSSLPTANPKIRKLLGDRKLWGFVRGYPQYFMALQDTVEDADGSGSTTRHRLRLLAAPPGVPSVTAATEPPEGWQVNKWIQVRTINDTHKHNVKAYINQNLDQKSGKSPSLQGTTH